MNNGTRRCSAGQVVADDLTAGWLQPVQSKLSIAPIAFLSAR